MERNVRLGEVSHLVMAFLHEERAVFPATRAAFEHEAREALQTVRPGRRGVKTLGVHFALMQINRDTLQCLLAPNADSPLNCDAGNLMRSGDMRGFNSMARMSDKY